MRRYSGAFLPIPALVLVSVLAAPAAAQTSAGSPGASQGLPGAGPSGPAPGRNITATGKTMPPAMGRAPEAKTPDAKMPDAKTSDTKAKASDAKLKASTEAEMLKAQKATEARNKAWDSKMRKTMGSICSGC